MPDVLRQIPSMSGTQPVCTAARGKASLGSRAQTCRGCLRAQLDTRETVSNGLRLIRIRYGIPFSEFPDLKPEELNRYLSFLLLEGKPRAAVPFPRRQVWVGNECYLQRMWRRTRWEFAHSVASIKRSLPAGCRLHVPSARSSWEKNAFSNPPPPSPEYLAFARKMVRRIFPFGWDRAYESFVNSHLPNATSRESGETASFAWSTAGGGGINSFRRMALVGSRCPPSPFKARYKEVMSAGKVRPLIIYSDMIDVLAPLHKMLYKHLSKLSWLLVGPPTVERVSSVCVREYQTSIDLVSATDNLPLPVADAVLGALLAKCSNVPGWVRQLAHLSLQPFVGGNQVTHGQMMGGYLSFPLLCLQSWIAASWAVRGCSAKILVNGDDTLISADRPVLSSDYPPGFVLNELKTIRSRVVAEINSTAFVRSMKGRWREIRHLRRGGFLADYPGMLHIAAAVRDSPCWSTALIRSRIGKKWGFLPSQLGLSRESYPVFQREREMGRRRCFTPLPEAPFEVDPSLQAVSRELDTDERLATTFYLFNRGRWGGRKRDVFRPTVGGVRRGYSYRSRPPRFYLTYLSELKWSRRERNYGRQVRNYVLSEYISLAEGEAIRGLHQNVVLMTED